MLGDSRNNGDYRHMVPMLASVAPSLDPSHGLVWAAQPPFIHACVSGLATCLSVELVLSTQELFDKLFYLANLSWFLWFPNQTPDGTFLCLSFLIYKKRHGNYIYHQRSAGALTVTMYVRYLEHCLSHYKC